jgi:flagellar basal body rod protein FlgG
MNYGLYLAASGAISGMDRQEVLTNNLVNSTTVGFKPDLVFARQRLPERLASASAADPKLLLEKLGGGPALMPTRMDLRQGPLEMTGNELDVAIEGAGYLVVQSRTGGGPQDVRLTRDGRLTITERGELVMAATGKRVLDTRNHPIVLDRDRPVDISGNGDVWQEGTRMGTIQLAAPKDVTRLVKDGDNLLRDDSGGSIARRPAEGRLQQRYLESSAVEPISALNDLMNSVKSIQANITMMQYHDHIMGQAVNTMGRVA